MESSSILNSGNFKNLNVNGNSLFNDVHIKGNHSLLGSNIIKQDLTVEGITKIHKLEIYNKTTNEFNNIYLEEDNSNLYLVVKLHDGTTKKITFN